MNQASGLWENSGRHCKNKIQNYVYSYLRLDPLCDQMGWGWKSAQRIKAGKYFPLMKKENWDAASMENL